MPVSIPTVPADGDPGNVQTQTATEPATAHAPVASPTDPTAPAAPGNPAKPPFIDVTDLLVPGIGRVQPLDQMPFAIIRDGDDVEVEIITTALSLMEGVSQSTYGSYANAILRLCRFLWAIGSSPSTMTRREYRAYRRWLDKCNQLPTTMRVPNRHNPYRFVDITGHLSDATIDQAESAARTLYNCLEENETIDISPVPATAASRANKGGNPLDAPRKAAYGRAEPGTVRPLRRKRTRSPQPLTPELRQHLLDDPTARGRAMWRLMLESGPRINEVNSMQPERMYLDENRIDVLGKGLLGETRWVPVTDAFVSAFTEYQQELASRGHHLVNGVSVWRSLRRPHAPVQYEALRAAMQTRLRQVTNQRSVPHSLRHTAATAMLVDLGLSIEQVQKVLGHEHLASTQTYLHADLNSATQSFVKAWRDGRTRPALDISDLYDADLINDFLGALDD